MLFRRGRARRPLVGAARRTVELVRRAGRRRRRRDDDDGTPGRLGRRLPGVEPESSYLATGRGASAGSHAARAVLGARRAGALVVPVRRPPHRGLLPDRPQHGHAVAPARVADRARHAGRRARPRAQQPGLGDGRAPSTRCRRRATRCSRRSCGWPSARCSAEQFIALEASAASSTRRPPATTRCWWPTARRRSRTGWPTTASTTGGASRRRSRPPVSTSTGASAPPAVLDGDHARTGPRVGGRHARAPGCCSPR